MGERKEIEDIALKMSIKPNDHQTLISGSLLSFSGLCGSGRFSLLCYVHNTDSSQSTDKSIDSLRDVSAAYLRTHLFGPQRAS